MSANNNNHYTSPTSAKSSTQESIRESNPTLHLPRSVGAGHGIFWLKEGFALFQKAPLPWMGVMMVWGIVLAVSTSFPPACIAQPFVTAGIAAICWRLDSTGEFALKDLTSGFTHQAGSLLLVGVISACGSLIIVGIGSMFGFGALLSLMSMSPDALNSPEATSMMLTLLLLLFVAAALLTPLIMAAWYAPILIILHNTPTIEAMKLSFKACIHNVLPILVISLIVLPLLFLAAIPAFLGYLILIPVLLASVYTSYKDIFISTH